MASSASERKILQAAADLYLALGVLNVSRRDIVEQSGLGARTVNSVAHTRSEFLRLVVQQLPYSPVTEKFAKEFDNPNSPALELLMTASRDIWGDPASAWDPRELEALAGAQFDEKMVEILAERIQHRWNASRALVERLKASGAIDPTMSVDAIVLHLIAVGIGISLLTPVLKVTVDPQAWTALSARLLESLAAVDPELPQPGDQTNYWRVRTTIAANPTATARLLRVLSLLDTAIVYMTVVDLTDEEQQMDAIVKAPMSLARTTLYQAVDSVGREVIVVHGSETDAGDIASRVLRMSSNLVQWPEQAPQAAADLVLARSWEVTDATTGPNASENVLRLQWTVDRHVVLRRDQAPFTRVEYERASALLELVEAITTVRDLPTTYGWVEELTDDTTVWVRLARPEDTWAVEDLHQRASEQSIYQRYFTPKNTWREENLRRVSGGHRGATLVVTDRAHHVIALCNIFPESEDNTDSGEIAILVDDSWHRRGLGSMLIRHSEEIGERLGFRRLVAYVLANNAAMQGLLRSHDWTLFPSPEFGPGINAFEKKV
jgi:RimJ/RimL family protein N-acetyltransferase